MAATNKCLVHGNKSRAAHEATNERDTRPAPIRLMCPMKPTMKIRFTEPEIALVMRAHPNCNLDRLAEIPFEFDHSGKIIDCIGTIKDSGSNVDHDYAGGASARLYETSQIGRSKNQRYDIAISKRREACNASR
jgi:hypothetical protein